MRYSRSSVVHLDSPPDTPLTLPNRTHLRSHAKGEVAPSLHEPAPSLTAADSPPVHQTILGHLESLDLRCSSNTKVIIDHLRPLSHLQDPTRATPAPSTNIHVTWSVRPRARPVPSQKWGHRVNKASALSLRNLPSFREVDGNETLKHTRQ